MIGRTLSQYRITSALGAGAMGEVYRATDTRPHRDVAIKALPTEVAQDPDRGPPRRRQCLRPEPPTSVAGLRPSRSKQRRQRSSMRAEKARPSS